MPLLLRPRERLLSIVMSTSVCVCVCVCVCQSAMITPGSTHDLCQILRTLPLAVARSSSGDTLCTSSFVDGIRFFL